jgi:hypothetical protein
MSKEEPDGAVCIFEEVSPHFEYFISVHFLDIIAIFEALFTSIEYVFTMCQQIKIRW